MSDRAAARPFHHLGYVVQDLEAAAERFARTVGAGPFLRIDHVPLTDVTYRGEPGRYDHSTAFGQWGPVIVEISQVHDAEPTGLEAFMSAPRLPAIGHVAWLVDDLEAESARLQAAGMPLVHTGRSGPVAANWHDGGLLLGHPGGGAAPLPRDPRLLRRDRRGRPRLGRQPAAATRARPAVVITGAHHVGLSVADLPAMIEWYRDALGFELEVQFEIPGGEISGAMLRRPDGTGLELLHHVASAPQQLGDPHRAMLVQGYGHWALAVDRRAGHARGAACRRRARSLESATGPAAGPRLDVLSDRPRGQPAGARRGVTLSTKEKRHDRDDHHRAPRRARSRTR